MRIKLTSRWISGILALVMVVCLPAGRCMGQTVSGDTGGQTVSSTGSDDGSGLDQRITLVVFLIVVGVLFWVGWKMDREHVEADPAERLVLERKNGPEVFVDLGGLPEDDTGATITSGPELELAGSIGLQVRF